MAANSMAAQNPGAPTRTHAPSTAAASAADSQAVCHFLDKVAAEIRVMIYEHVFGASEYARFSSTPTKHPVSATNAEDTEKAPPAMINTSILATSKQIREEALDAFYNTKIVRFDFAQLRNLLDSRASGGSAQLDMVQNIQIVDCNQAEPEDSIHSILKEALALPRIKSLSILSDCLTGPNRRHVTVREEAHRLGLGPVTCCDVGHYRINDQPGHVQFINSKLVKMWPSAASMPDDYDALDEAYVTRSGRGLTEEHQNLMAWASHTSFRLWVGLHEAITGSVSNEDVVEVDDDSAAAGEAFRRRIDRFGFFRAAVSDPPRVRHVSDSPDQHVPLHKLDPQHDPVRLEQATELLAMNVGRYKWANPDDDDDWDTQKEIEPSWVELGRPNVLDIQQENQHRLRTLWREHSTIDWPTDLTRAFDVSDVREELLSCPVFSPIFGEETIRKAGKRELQQMWYLRLAVYRPSEDGGNEEAKNIEQADGGEEGGDREAGEIVDDDEAAMHQWSDELMRKYLSSLERVDKADLAAVSEINMRKAFLMTLTLASELAEPPSLDLEATDPSTSDTQSSAKQPENTAEQAVNEHQFGDEAAGGPASDEATNIDEDVYQPFLDSHATVLSYMFKSAVAGDLNALDLGRA